MNVYIWSALVVVAICVWVLQQKEMFSQCPAMAPQYVAHIDQQRAFDKRFVRPSEVAPIDYIQYPMNRLPH